MTKDEVAAALDVYHNNLIVMANAIVADKAPRPDGKKPGYTFRTEEGEELPQLDVLAAALRSNNAS